MPIARSLFFEIAGFIADSVVNRSVEHVRVGAFARTSVLDQVIELAAQGDVEDKDQFTFTGVDENTMTFIKSSAAVDVTVTTDQGSLKLPAQRVMILNSAIETLLIENVANDIPVQVHILHT